jgi:predicted HicB family RNase H-like nuclease
VITFQGRRVEVLKVALEDSVEDYLEFCETRGEELDKPYSGKFVLRVEPALHRRLSALSVCFKYRGLRFFLPRFLQ